MTSHSSSNNGHTSGTGNGLVKLALIAVGILVLGPLLGILVGFGSGSPLLGGLCQAAIMLGISYALYQPRLVCLWLSLLVALPCGNLGAFVALNIGGVAGLLCGATIYVVAATCGTIISLMLVPNGHDAWRESQGTG